MEDFVLGSFLLLMSLCMVGGAVHLAYRSHDLVTFCFAVLFAGFFGIAGLAMVAVQAVSAVTGIDVDFAAEWPRFAIIVGLLTAWFGFELLVRRNRYNAEFGNWTAATRARPFGQWAYVVNEHRHAGETGVLLAWHRGPMLFLPNLLFRDSGFFNRITREPDFRRTRIYSHYASEQAPLLRYDSKHGVRLDPAKVIGAANSRR